MGGGVMRTAAKAAKVASSAAHAPWVDHAAAAAAACRSSRAPVAAVSVAGQAAATAEGMKSSSASPGDNGAVAAKRGPSMVDDWEFAGGMEEELSERPAPLRLVFGPVPTLEEAKEATADLKNALDQVYFSSAAAGFDSSAVHAMSASSGSSCVESLDAKKALVGVLPSCPNHVVQAFSFLQASPQAQDVVASLACDKNIWDAVMKNEMVMEFYKTHQIKTAVDSLESVEDLNLNSGSPIGEEAPERSPGDGLKGFVEFIKVKFEEMTNRLSGFVKDFMVAAGAGDSSPATATATKTTGSAGTAADINLSLGASFLALAVAAILTILFKRG
ncbi:unnamed protein product [Spirodela intermedia]|uniref:Uncharacterized protein n=1 Tax=Spirodela intermedia TaxID=51605 RepID=A0A7I8K9Y9_SPIIN|nr:unnamed protein product [Spirodela intermedia]